MMLAYFGGYSGGFMADVTPLSHQTDFPEVVGYFLADMAALAALSRGVSDHSKNACQKIGDFTHFFCPPPYPLPESHQSRHIRH